MGSGGGIIVVTLVAIIVAFGCHRWGHHIGGHRRTGVVDDAAGRCCCDGCRRRWLSWTSSPLGRDNNAGGGHIVDAGCGGGGWSVLSL